ncbi:hypothetical protein AQI88_37420 [Streptomyces cellostaticus]|uniref:Lipoprotein n=1 Tax=Streptomyces cellostaticus TaxID=67285 RepID=A0A124HBH7_9ACTN|nr:hypothetical protein [Streptomyces cellostaticus]KUM91327.1 hypothetical protein AQI88_37420 [Streptomyces cellostaticus]GHI04476.1 lipoprotein [Streptomyces cellostaticus]
MPYPPPPRTPSGPRRRSLLASAAGAALLVGCSAGPDSADGGGTPSVTARVRARAARDSAGLLERYDAVLATHPALAGRLRPLRATVAAHAEAFGGAAATKSPSPTASTASSAPPSAVPAAEKDALAELAAAERTLADRRAKALLDVEGELARLMASVAAAGAAHAYLLTEGAK